MLVPILIIYKSGERVYLDSQSKADNTAEGQGHRVFACHRAQMPHLSCYTLKSMFDSLACIK